MEAGIKQLILPCVHALCVRGCNYFPYSARLNLVSIPEAGTVRPLTFTTPFLAISTSQSLGVRYKHLLPAEVDRTFASNPLRIKVTLSCEVIHVSMHKEPGGNRACGRLFIMPGLPTN